MITTPWYKYPWAWFLLFLPLCAVIGSFTSLYFAVSTDLSLSSDDYYKEGQNINAELARIQLAKDMNLSFELECDNNYILLKQLSGPNIDMPIQLKFIHSTLDYRDRHFLLEKNKEGVYYQEIEPLLKEKFHLLLTAVEQNWKLKRTVTFENVNPSILFQ